MRTVEGRFFSLPEVRLHHNKIIACTTCLLYNLNAKNQTHSHPPASGLAEYEYPGSDHVSDQQYSISDDRKSVSMQGNNAALCLVAQYTNATNTYQQYYIFRITIDQFTSLQLNGLSALLMASKATNATLTIQFQNEASGTDFPILLNNTNSSMLQRSVISAVVNTVNGGFSSIADDNFCDSSCGACYNGDCFDNFNNYSSPDLKVYVSWAGSDSNNNQYLS